MYFLIPLLITQVFLTSSVPVVKPMSIGRFPSGRYFPTDWYSCDYNADDLINEKIQFHPREINDISTRMRILSQILGFDAEDSYNKKLNLHEIGRIAGQIQQITQVLKSEDLGNGLGRRLKRMHLFSSDIHDDIPRVPQLAETVYHICRVMGYDAEDMDDFAISTACAVIGAICALAGTGCNIYSHVKGADENEALEFSVDEQSVRVPQKEIILTPKQVKKIIHQIMQK